MHPKLTAKTLRTKKLGTLARCNTHKKKKIETHDKTNNENISFMFGHNSSAIKYCINVGDFETHGHHSTLDSSPESHEIQLNRENQCRESCVEHVSSEKTTRKKKKKKHGYIELHHQECPYISAAYPMAHDDILKYYRRRGV